jgi:hypothetical protein
MPSPSSSTTFFSKLLASKKTDEKMFQLPQQDCNPEPRTRDGEASNQLLKAKGEAEGM